MDGSAGTAFEVVTHVDPALTARGLWLFPRSALTMLAVALVPGAALWLATGSPALGAVICMLVLVGSPVATWWQAAARGRAAGDPAVRLRMDPDAVTLTSPLGAVRLPWERVTGLRCTRSWTAVQARPGFLVVALPVVLDDAQRDLVARWRANPGRPASPVPASPVLAAPAVSSAVTAADTTVRVSAALDPGQTALMVAAMLVARRAARRARLMMVVMGLAALGWIHAQWLLEPDGVAPGWAVRLVLTGVIVSLLAIALVAVPHLAGRPARGRRARRLHARLWAGDPAVTWTFSPEGSHFASSSFETKIAWADVREVAVARGTFRVGDGTRAVVVPLGLIDAGRIAAVRALAARHASPGCLGATAPD